MTEKTALVFSAGGMFGAYQAGAWQEIASRFRPDIVVGTSVGALNGWAVAGGCPPEELISYWLDPAAAGFLDLRVAPPWLGFFDVASFRARVQHLYSQYTPYIPLGVVITDLLRLRSRLVRTPEITVDHLAAACAIPCAFPPVRIDHRLYVDGGLLSVLPLWAAAEMGATRVIAINALPLMPSTLLRGMAGAVRWLSRERHTAGALEVATISPSEPLGSISESVRWDPGRIARWVALGAQDARSTTIGFLCPPIRSIV